MTAQLLAAPSRGGLARRIRVLGAVLGLVAVVAAAQGPAPVPAPPSLRVLDRFDGGLTIGGVLDRLPEDPSEWPEVQGPIERAVLDLLEPRESSATLERI